VQDCTWAQQSLGPYHLHERVTPQGRGWSSGHAGTCSQGPQHWSAGLRTPWCTRHWRCQPPVGIHPCHSQFPKVRLRPSVRTPPRHPPTPHIHSVIAAAGAGHAAPKAKGSGGKKNGGEGGGSHLGLHNLSTNAFKPGQKVVPCAWGRGVSQRPPSATSPTTSPSANTWPPWADHEFGEAVWIGGQEKEALCRINTHTYIHARIHAHTHTCTYMHTYMHPLLHVAVHNFAQDLHLLRQAAAVCSGPKWTHIPLLSPSQGHTHTHNAGKQVTVDAPPSTPAAIRGTTSPPASPRHPRSRRPPRPTLGATCAQWLGHWT
jgi:hypothetical protein